jgi:hypothetical protein
MKPVTIHAGMRLRAHALALLGALAFLLASTGAHGHANGTELDKPCAVCAAQAQSRASCPDPELGPAFETELSIALFHPEPLSLSHWTWDSAAARAPPLTA